MPGRHVHFATCSPGLEPVLHGEIRALRLARVERQVGGVRFEGDDRDLARANLELRTAIRVLRRLARFPAPDADALYAGVRALPWEDWLDAEGSLIVDAQTRDSALTHARFLEQRTKDAIVDRLRARRGARPSVDRADPDLAVHVHLWRDRATVSLDSSGESLHRRGWRRYQGTAPLAETLAAAVVLLSGWDRRAPLVDPFAGSGTLLVEAAHLAAGRAPGLARAFAFERWPGIDARGVDRLRDELRARVALPGKLRVVGSDSDPERVREARENAAAAGVADVVTVEVADALALDPRPGWNAWIVSNLPYGVRVAAGEETRSGAGEGEDALVALHRAFGERLRARCAGYHLALLVGSARLARALGLKVAARHRLQNGALPVELLVTDVFARV